MKKYTFWTIAAVVLLLVNMLIIGYLWQKQHPRPGQRPPGGEAFMYLVTELKMTKEQVTQYQRLRDDHRSKADHILEQGREIKQRLFSNLGKTGVGASIVNSITAEAGRNTAALDSLTFYHFREVRMILNDKQKERFDEVIDDALRMMAGPGPGGPPGRPPGPPPHGDRPPRPHPVQ